jgi:hypothetical protein
MSCAATAFRPKPEYRVVGIPFRSFTVAVLTGVDFFTVEVAHLAGLGYLLRALLHPTVVGSVRFIRHRGSLFGPAAESASNA